MNNNSRGSTRNSNESKAPDLLLEVRATAPFDPLEIITEEQFHKAAYEFDHGTPFVRKAEYIDQIDYGDLTHRQPMLPFSVLFCRSMTATLISATVFGLAWTCSKVAIIRVGSIGIVQPSYNIAARVLPPGCYFLETVHGTHRVFDIADNVIVHGNVKIIRIPPGSWGLATQNGQPVLMEPGTHFVNDPLFIYGDNQQPVSQNQQHIAYGALHVVFVANGLIGAIMLNGEGHFLKEGTHIISSPRFEYIGIFATTHEHIRAGTKHRVLVPAGSIGLATENLMPRLLDAGRVYYVSSPNFMYVGSKSIATSIINHGSIKIITVKDGHSGISYDEGQILILKPGRHVLDRPTHVFGGFITVGQETLAIADVVSMSSDNVGLKFDGAITIQVVDVKKAVTMLSRYDGSSEFSDKDLHKNILAKAKLALSIIIGNNKFNDAFRSTVALIERTQAVVNASDHSQQPAYNPEVVETKAGDPTSFRQHVHDVFMKQFADQMVTECGVRVIDMSIEDIQITNRDLDGAMARAAVAMTEYQKAIIDMEIRETQALTQKKAEVIEAQGHAQAMSILAAAESDRIAKLDMAISAANPVTQQRELIRASAEALQNANSSIILAHSAVDIASLLSAGNIGNGGLLQNLTRK